MSNIVCPVCKGLGNQVLTSEGVFITPGLPNDTSMYPCYVCDGRGVIKPGEYLKKCKKIDDRRSKVK